MKRTFQRGALAAAAATLGLGLSGHGWAAAVFVESDPNTVGKCIGNNASGVLYRVNPGPTSARSTADGPVAGSGNGTYGWISGCSTVGTGLGYTVLGSFADGGNFTGVTALGFISTAGADFATALGAESRASGIASTALGVGSFASGGGAVAIGGGGASALNAANATIASGAGSIAMGVNATKGAQAAAVDSIALGAESSVAAAATTGIAIGQLANAQGVSGVALGAGALSGATGNNVAIGAFGTAANALDATGGAVAIGRAQKATGNGAVAIGDPNLATGTGAVALGADNTAAGDAAGTAAADGAVAIGNGNAALGTGNIAIGSTSKASGAGAIALGVGAGASADNAVAMGTGAKAGEAGAVALGSGSLTAAAVGTTSTVIDGATYNFAGTTPVSTVSVGAPGAERTITNVAAGRLSASSTDAVNGSQLAASNQAIEYLAAIANTVPNTWIIGSPVTYVAPASSGTNSTAAGSGASVNASNSVAIGTGANATTDNSVALGTNVAFAVNQNPVFTSVSIEGGPHFGSDGIDAGGTPITNVAPGVKGTDAVNLNQLNAAVDAATAGLQSEIDKTARKAYAGVASALSLEDAPFIPGKTTFAAALGYFRSEAALGVALRRTSDNGRWSITGGLAGSSGGVAARAGFGGVIE